METAILFWRLAFGMTVRDYRQRWDDFFTSKVEADQEIEKAKRE